MAGDRRLDHPHRDDWVADGRPGRRGSINVLNYLTRCYQAHLDGRSAPSLLTSEPVIQAA